MTEQLSTNRECVFIWNSAGSFGMSGSVVPEVFQCVLSARPFSEEILARIALSAIWDIVFSLIDCSIEELRIWNTHRSGLGVWNSGILELELKFEISILLRQKN